MNLKNRVKKVEEKVNPTKFARMEDILKILHLEEQKNRTADEEKQLVELKKMPVDPEFEEKLKKILENRAHSDCKEL